MKDKNIGFFLFPHSVAPDEACRQLAVLLPAVSVLKTLESSASWAPYRNTFTDWPVIGAGEEEQRVQALLTQYRQLGEMHGDMDLLAAAAGDLGTDKLAESRFGIQDRVRGRSDQKPSETDRLRQESAVFLELAKDLDEKELELENGLSRAQRLEGDFRDILGVSNDDELKSVVETTTAPLATDWGYFSYQTKRRIRSWWRLFAGSAPVDQIVLVALFKEMVDEFMDPIKTEKERSGSQWDPLQVTVAELPLLEFLPEEQFVTLEEYVDGCGILPPYQEALFDLIAEPGNQSKKETMHRVSIGFQEIVESYLEDQGLSLAGSSKLILTEPEGVSWAEVWQRMDREGFDACAGSPVIQQPIRLMHLE